MNGAPATQCTQSRKQRALNTHRGIPNRLDPAQAIKHLDVLRKTMGWNHIAKATGCSAAYLRRITNGQVPVINRVTHNKIMSAQPAAVPDRGFYVSATGARRRIQALMARGHAQHTIATAAGTTTWRIHLICKGEPGIRQHTADNVARAYELLAHTDGSSTRSRNMAASNGWPGPDYWADVDRIDDPAFDPDATQLRIEQIAEDAEFLLARGLDTTQVAERLDITRDYLTKALRESAGKRVAA